MPKFKKSEWFDKRAKGTYLSLVISALEDAMKKEGKRLAESLVNNSKDEGMQQLCERNFMDNIRYGITEMLYIEELAAKDDIVTGNDRPEQLIKMYEGGDLHGINLLTWLLPCNFNYKEKRFFTEDEMKIKQEQIAITWKKAWEKM